MFERKKRDLLMCKDNSITVRQISTHSENFLEELRKSCQKKDIRDIKYSMTSDGCGDVIYSALIIYDKPYTDDAIENGTSETS